MSKQGDFTERWCRYEMTGKELCWKCKNCNAGLSNVYEAYCDIFQMKFLVEGHSIECEHFKSITANAKEKEVKQEDMFREILLKIAERLEDNASTLTKEELARIIYEVIGYN